MDFLKNEHFFFHQVNEWAFISSTALFHFRDNQSFVINSLVWVFEQLCINC